MAPLEQLRASLRSLTPMASGPSTARELLQTYQCSAAELPVHARRFLRMLDRFEAEFPGEEEVRLFRAPGRVNLIGEHTDYNGYPVLPIAIDRDIAVVAAQSSDDFVEVRNTDPAYPPRQFRLVPSIEPYDQGDWGNYVKASIQGLISEGLLTSRARGFRATVDGNIPDSAGLSSSAALVVVTALAALAVNDVVVDPLHLAEVLAKAERYVGTEGGGMDQAISLLGCAGNALKIDFFPLRVERVPFPDDYAIVVSNSLVRATKSAGARDHYNRRVVECRFAAALGSHALRTRLGKDIDTMLLSDLAPSRLGIQEEEVDLLLEQESGVEPLSLRALASKLGAPLETVKERYCRLRNGSTIDEPPDGLKVWQRYRHVVTEARRVEQARDALRWGKIETFGHLMFESHESCRDDYEVSCPELETLVDLARILKATGSRLTGAGFGGCTVSLVAKEKAPEFARALWQEYSATLHRPPEAGTQDPVFVCGPAQGAGELFVSS